MTEQEVECVPTALAAGKQSDQIQISLMFVDLPMSVIASS